MNPFPQMFEEFWRRYGTEISVIAVLTVAGITWLVLR